LLILPNAWDAGSARLIESLGARAIATTSAGVAWSHGHPDGGRLPAALVARTAADVVAAVSVPVSIDVEDGYSKDPAEVGETVGAVLAAGAVGINIEDGGDPPELLCAKIESVKHVAKRRGVDVFVNARTDVYLRDLASAGSRAAEVRARAERYRSAGADGIFVPGLFASDEIRDLAGSLPLPLNVMAWRGLPGPAELEALGARRLSAGAEIAQKALSRAKALATAFLRTGAFDDASEKVPSYAALNELMRRAPE
jgi:2-methylisocitrate lyase-like PEP mutase family enzyme